MCYSISVKNFIIAFLLSVLLLSLMCELQEYYATSISYIDNWEVNSKCCAFSVQHKQWYRAIIVELLPDNQAKVNSIHTNSGFPIGSWDSIMNVVTVLWHGWFGVHKSWERQAIFSSPKLSRQVVGATQPPFQWITRFFSQEWMWWGMKLTTYLHLLSRLRMSDAITLLPVNAFVARTGQLFSSPVPSPFRLSCWSVQLLICYTT